MPTINIPSVEDHDDIQQQVYAMIDAYERLRKELTWLLNKNIDTKNARELGGWLIRPDKFVSNDGNVGMSTTEDGDDPVRFFASPEGDLWLWYVTKSGEMVAQKATIKGHIDAESGTIGGWTIEADKLSGTGKIQGGVIEGAEINGAAINGGTINVETNVTIGKKLFMPGNDFGNGIVWSGSGIEIYIDPGSGALRLIAPGGIYANGIKIDVKPSPPSP